MNEAILAVVHDDERRFKAAVAQAAKALRDATCICRSGRNQHGIWYHVQPECPVCGDSEAKARVAVAAIWGEL